MKEDGYQKGLTSSLPWWFSLIPVSEISNSDHIGNLILLVEILRNCELVGDKLLFFSQSITTLEKEFLTMEDSKSRKFINTTEGGDFLL
jgi:hypothetical protein